VREVPEDLDLSKGAETEHGVVKRRNALDGYLSACCAVDRAAHDPIRPLAWSLASASALVSVEGSDDEENEVPITSTTW
jgi:hypothetical protein